MLENVNVVLQKPKLFMVNLYLLPQI